MPIVAITPIWYMVVAMVGQIVPVTYWWSCVAYSGLLKVAKSVTGSFFSRLDRFNRGSKSARAWVWSSTSWVQSCQSYSVVVLMVVENVLTVDQTLPSYQCRTAVVLRSYRQSWTDTDRELRPRSDVFVTIMTDRGGLLWSGTSAKNDRHSVTWAIQIVSFNVWVRYFVWNLKGTLWNSNKISYPYIERVDFIHRWNLRALRFKSSYVFLKRLGSIQKQAIRVVSYLFPAHTCAPNFCIFTFTKHNKISVCKTLPHSL